MPLPPHPLAALDQIIETPSRRDGIPEVLEMDLRAVGCQLIQELGILVELPQSTMATAQVLLHRFFYVSSMLSFSVVDIALASLYLSSKVCETPIRLRDLLNVYVLLLSRIQHLQSTTTTPTPFPLNTLLRQKDPFPDFTYDPPPFHSSIFYELKDGLIVAEIQILKRLGFNMQVDLPYSHMVNYCKILDLVGREGVVQLCWGILNDAHQTPIYTHHPPHTIACFSILLATRLRRIPLPDNWWHLFDAEYEDMWACCGAVMRLWEDFKVGPVEFKTQDEIEGRGGGGEEDMVIDVDEEQSGNGNGNGKGGDKRKGKEKQTEMVLEVSLEQEARWRRAWKLLLNKKYVRRWVDGEAT